MLAALFGNASFAAAQWLIVLVLARLGGPGEVGTFALATAIATPLVATFAMGLRVIAATSHDVDRYIDDYVVLRVVGGVLSFIAMFVLGTLGIVEGELLRVSRALTAAKAIEGVSDVIYGIQQSRSDISSMTLSLVLRSVLGLITFAFGYWYTHSLTLSTIALAGAWLAALLLWDLARAPTSGKAVIRRLAFATSCASTRSTLYKHVQVAWPLGLATVLYMLMTMVPRYFVGAKLGMDALGIFAASVHLIIVGELIVRSINQVASARLARWATSPHSLAFRQLVLQLVMASFAIGVLGLLIVSLIGSDLLRFLYGADFASGGPVLIWLAGVGALMYLAATMGYVLTALRIVALQAQTIAIAVVLNAFLCAVLVRHFGLYGVAAAWGAALCVPLVIGWGRVVAAVRSRSVTT